jgi:UDP-glucuronate 4-epimerase
MLGVEVVADGDIGKSENLTFYHMDIADRKALDQLFDAHDFDVVCNLAAQAGVRYSIDNPDAYLQSNLVGFHNILECVRHSKCNKLVYASSSSVYGNCSSIPFSESHQVDTPISLYAATKKSNELTAHTYAHLYGIEMIGLRFFTVYGEWGRPDMAIYLFADAIANDKPIKVFNHGDLSRDFTYVEDIVNGVVATITRSIPGEEKYKIYNIGASKPVKLLDFIDSLEMHMGKKAVRVNYPMQPGDVEQTYADVSSLEQDFGYAPTTDIDEGIQNFVTWYKNYHG